MCLVYQNVLPLSEYNKQLCAWALQALHVISRQLIYLIKIILSGERGKSMSIYCI